MSTIQNTPQRYKIIYTLIGFGIFSAFPLLAQPTQSDFQKFVAERKQKFNKFEAETRQRYEEFRNKTNAEFAEFMQRKWTAVETQSAIPAPARPEPPRPTIKDPQDKTEPVTERLSTSQITDIKPILPQPSPSIPIIEPSHHQSSVFSFLFYNTPCEVRLANSQRFKLPDVKEKTVADTWRSLGTDLMDQTLIDCLTLRDYLLLGDWGYVNLLKTMTESFFKTPCSEAVLLQMYLLTQSGYKVRLARSNNSLVLLLPFPDNVYNFRYIDRDGTKFYIMDTAAPTGGYYVFDFEFPKETMPSLRQTNLPALKDNLTAARTFTSNRYLSLRVNVATNRNLIDFYNNYPVCSQWQYYVSCSLSEEVKKSLYPALQTQIKGLSQQEAVSVLLDFVQTAFEYQTDFEQFGYERPLFGDETFFYPYSDCEDRSILFAILVRELVGLDVVLLNYPEHLATAVKFTETQPAGTYFELQDGNYIICDPTYIHAGIGECMPQYRETSATIVRI